MLLRIFVEFKESGIKKKVSEGRKKKDIIKDN